MNNMNQSSNLYSEICTGIVRLVEGARHSAIRSVNAFMTATYWEIGRRIVEFEQAGAERAAYGEGLIERLSEELTQRFGRGFSRQNIQQMRLFYLAWPPIKNCQTVSGNSIPLTVSAEFGSLENLAKLFPLPYALEGLPNKVIAAEYQTLLPNEGQLVEALRRRQESLKTRKISQDLGLGKLEP